MIFICCTIVNGARNKRRRTFRSDFRVNEITLRVRQ